jgi:hypothetical protein
MGRLLAGLLALCFVVDPIVGVSAWLQIEKAIVRREVRRHIVSGLDKDGLVLLEFARSETEPLLRWEHSGEFEYDGQMYDIVESWTQGDTVYYRCFWDRAETRLNNRMRELAVRSHGDAPKFGGAEGFGRSTPGSPVFVVTREWEIPPPRSPARRPGGISERFSSRNIPPLAPPPWPV